MELSSVSALYKGRHELREVKPFPRVTQQLSDLSDFKAHILYSWRAFWGLELLVKSDPREWRREAWAVVKGRVPGGAVTMTTRGNPGVCA